MARALVVVGGHSATAVVASESLHRAHGLTRSSESVERVYGKSRTALAQGGGVPRVLAHR